MGMTFAEKAIARGAGRPAVKAGDFVEIRPDVILSHDNTPLICEVMREIGVDRLADPTRVAVGLDHSPPVTTPEAARLQADVRRFVRDRHIQHFFEVGRGICHQVLVEEGLCLPGECIVGTDPHTPHAGFLGCLGLAVGPKDLAALWASGRIWVRVPESLRISIRGRLGEHVTAKDLALRALGDLGPTGADYLSVEWTGEAVEALTLPERAVLANMSSAMGAKNAYIASDRAAFEYLETRARRPFEALYPDEDASYARVHGMDAGGLGPMVAAPGVRGVLPVSEVAGTPIAHAFLGSCTNGRSDDIAAAADVVRGRRLKARLLVVPASSQEYSRALRAGDVLTLMDAGAVFGSPGCGPCAGDHAAFQAPGEATISSAGRAGASGGEIYLASPRVVAASAVAGAIIHPADLPARKEPS
jgi:3-isopropylmalate dehydratase large subunit